MISFCVILSPLSTNISFSYNSINLSKFNMIIQQNGTFKTNRSLIVLKYKYDNYSFICDFNETITKILTITNHKTGTIFFLHLIMNNIFNYWAHKCIYNKQNQTYIYDGNLHTKRDVFKTSFSASGHGDSYKVSSFFQKSENKQDTKYIIILNIIRDPVDTVLSGYNYHKITNIEAWTAIKISTKRSRGPCHEFKHFMQKNFIQYFDRSFNDIYQNENISEGLKIEYYRYYFCNYPKINGSYHTIEDVLKPKYKYDTSKVLKNIRLGSFKLDFNASLNVIFDAFGILDIENRNNLLNILQGANAYHSNGKKIDKQTKKHMTDGKYDKNAQIDALLSDLILCQRLKIHTFSLGYPWKYEHYC